jgi:hypothetical protein
MQHDAIRRQIEELKVLHPELMDDEDAWEMSLESETQLNDFLRALVCKIEDAKALVVGMKDRFEELKARKDRYEHRIDVLRDLAFKLMQSADLPKLELPEATLSIRTVPPSVVITDEEKLPDLACKFERKPDKAKIKELLASGWVSGATMSNGSKALTIRIK